jgi:hypothetical protein
MRISRWVPEAVNTHSEYAVVIYFPLQQRYVTLYVKCLFCCQIKFATMNTRLLVRFQPTVKHAYNKICLHVWLRCSSW